MSRFSNLTYDSASQTAVVGAGMTWGQVYDGLAPYGVSVVGGRLPDVGVSGLVLGGGNDHFSFLPSFMLMIAWRYEDSPGRQASMA